MNAAPGDRLVIRPHHVGEHARTGIVLEARGPAGTAPFVVKWLDDEHDVLIFPGPDAVVEHVAAHEPRSAST